MVDFTFKDNTKVTDINGVPEKYRGLYAEGEGDDAGSYSVIPGAASLVGDFIGVTETLAGVRLDKKQVTDENATRRLTAKSFEDMAQTLGLEFGDDDNLSEMFNAFIGDLQGQVKGGKEQKINLDKIQAGADKRIFEVTTAKDSEIAEMYGALTKYLISQEATRALSEHKGSVDLLLPHVQNRCKVVKLGEANYGVQVLDEQGDARFDSSGGPLSVGGFVGEMKTQDKFARAFESEAPAGNGSTPGSMNRSTITNQGQQTTELSPTQKIAIGLKKGQAVDGRGGSTLSQ